MILVTGHFRLPPERLPEAEPAMRRVIQATLREDGCLDYSYAIEFGDPGLMRVFECWRDRQALAAHFATEHMVRWKKEREALGMTARSISLHEISASEPL